jgi:hypothetical protein
LRVLGTHLLEIQVKLEETAAIPDKLRNQKISRFRRFSPYINSTASSQANRADLLIYRLSYWAARKVTVLAQTRGMLCALRGRQAR